VTSQRALSLEKYTSPVARIGRGLDRLLRAHHTLLAQDSGPRFEDAGPSCPSTWHAQCIRHYRVKLEDGANRHFRANRFE
jgi:hypothetical protein